MPWWLDQSLWVSGFAVPKLQASLWSGFLLGQVAWRQARESLEKESGRLWLTGTWGTVGPSGSLLRDLTCWATGGGGADGVVDRVTLAGRQVFVTFSAISQQI